MTTLEVLGLLLAVLAGLLGWADWRARREPEPFSADLEWHGRRHVRIATIRMR